MRSTCGCGETAVGLEPSVVSADRHTRRTDDAVAKPVTRSKHVGDLARHGSFGDGIDAYRLGFVGVEIFAGGVHLLDPVSLERLQEAPACEFHAASQGLGLGNIRDVFQGEDLVRGHDEPTGLPLWPEHE